VSEARLATLAADLEHELTQLDALGDELALLRTRLPDPPTSIELRAAGSITHDFYSGVERMFRRIATVIDGDLPSGPNWHAELLERMSYPIADLRPAVISSDVRLRLEDYLRFRHVFRHIYGHALRWELLSPLVETTPDVHRALTQQVREFTLFLRGLARQTRSQGDVDHH
jgi:hypothetical protein